MNKPTWLLEVTVNNFYDKPGYECPKCRTKLLFEQSPELIAASDVIADRCPDCETYIVINMLNESPVLLEGYITRDELEERFLDLSSQFKK